MSDTATRSPADLVEQGRTLHREGRLDEAERLYAEALAADEDCAEAHQLMAVIAGQRGRFDEAIVGFRRSIALEGPTPDRLFNLAEAYRWSGKFDSAIGAYNQVLTLDAAFLDAYRNGAEMAKEGAAHAADLGDVELAQRLNRLAAHFLLGLGHASLRGGNESNAGQAYREAVTLNPASAEAFNGLAMIALQRHRPIEAETLGRKALALEPRSPLYLSNLGTALLSQVRIDEATALFRQAIEVDPSFEQARINLEERLLAWLHYRADLKPSAIFAAHRDWGRAAMARARKKDGLPAAFPNSRDPDRPLRIAYVGLDTGSRLAYGCIEPLLANHNPKEVTAVVYSTRGDGAAGALHFKKLVGSFQPLSLKRPQEAESMIRRQAIDILIDVAGHMRHNRLDVFARKPAPIALTWLGYPDTTGLPAIDYRLTDEAADPFGAEELYTERLYRMRAGSLVYRPPQRVPEVAALPAQAPGAVTFGYFDDPRKIAPEVIRVWSSILASLPEARLLLVAAEFADPGLVDRFSADFRAAGVDPARVGMRRAPEAPEKLLGTYAEVDIALDTFPYNNDPTTTCESLWMGVPLLTLSGDRACSRRSASILAQVGLERTISETPDEFADTAVELAQDIDRMRALRAGMRDRMRVSPLMDERGFARRFETALRDMWRQWCKSGT